MQIGFSFVNLAIGGAQLFYLDLIRELALRGHIIRYFLSANPKDSFYCHPELKRWIDLYAHQVKYPWNLLRSDVIHLDGYHSLRRKSIYFFQWGKCVETYHSAYSVRRSSPIFPAKRVAVSKAVQINLPEPTQVILQGIKLLAQNEKNNKIYDLGILGRIHPVKNHHLFFEICEKLFHNRGHCSAIIIGGHYTDLKIQVDIEAKIARLREIGVKIKLVGDVLPYQINSWLQQCRVLLVTSREEGFGRMAIEAMACSVPVVANPVGGLLEIIHPGINGFFAIQNDPDSFVGLTTKLLEDKNLRVKIGQQGQEFVERNFSIQNMVSAYENLYNEIVRKS
jgi:glycosyltransferase involved in cell wall biosynthesis